MRRRLRRVYRLSLSRLGQRRGRRKSRAQVHRPQRPKVDTLGLGAAAQLPSSLRTMHSSSMSASSRAWYEFDLAVLLALVSPIGNWLTPYQGPASHRFPHFLFKPNYRKYVPLFPFLLPTLTDTHPPYKVPCDLYQKSRPRRRSPSFPPLLSSADSPETTYRTYAASELRSFDLSLLFLTFISPFFGALLFRYATAAVLGPQSVSWFSTGLFVLCSHRHEAVVAPRRKDTHAYGGVA